MTHAKILPEKRRRAAEPSASAATAPASCTRTSRWTRHGTKRLGGEFEAACGKPGGGRCAAPSRAVTAPNVQRNGQRARGEIGAPDVTADAPAGCRGEVRPRPDGEAPRTEELSDVRVRVRAHLREGGGGWGRGARPAGPPAAPHRCARCSRGSNRARLTSARRRPGSRGEALRARAPR